MKQALAGTDRQEADRSGEETATCSGIVCPTCSYHLEALMFRCPRCLSELPLGCTGSCRECAHHRC